MKMQVMSLIAITFFALTVPEKSIAQHTRYELIDIGTLGGPSAHGPALGWAVNL